MGRGLCFKVKKIKLVSLNIKFKYLYREAGNFKIFGFVLFSNPKKLSIDTIQSGIISKLISGEFFENEKMGLPALHFEIFDSDLDHGWHELDGIETTSERQNDFRSIDEFLEIFNVC